MKMTGWIHLLCLKLQYPESGVATRPAEDNLTGILLRHEAPAPAEHRDVGMVVPALMERLGLLAAVPRGLVVALA